MNYYERQIKGLLLILEGDDDNFVSKEYIREKLDMILNGGINFHLLLGDRLNELQKISDDKICDKSW